jgi:hypothetical protein
MVHLGDSYNDLWMSIYDGTEWRRPDGTPGDERIPGQMSKAGPALAVFNNRLYMVHLGDSYNDLWMSIYDGTEWRKSDGTPGDERIPGQMSKAGPALAAFDNTLHLVHLGTGWSNDIWYSWSLGGNWSVNEKLFPIQKSHVSPTLVAGRQRLHMVHLGSTSRDIWHSRFDPSYVYPTCDIWADAPTVVGEFPGENRRIIATGHRTCQGTDPQPLPIRVRIRQHRSFPIIGWPDKTLAESDPTLEENVSVPYECSGAGDQTVFAEVIESNTGRKAQSPRVNVTYCS